MARLRSDFWVAAHLRRSALEGIDAVLRRRGSPEAGAIFVTVDRLDGHVDLYGPAPQSALTGDELDRLFAPVLLGSAPPDIEARMLREIRFDPDLWWISVDDRAGRSGLQLASETPG
ncbi:DUF1491 family protein [Enterovirga sp.]|jgi:hypothetical protein|uniref:DUF1491 family protein n=1 Tax=Enterovirga sp. TaxID=2026350 RepID=UPI00260BCDF0|nr:DUF1491 family protein [Enterovirga sp.]MDB5590694.1 hypothetical protein [Enterovirga sp.]